MTTIRPGEFWVADILFTDGSGFKKRPVLWLDASDAVVAAVTSALPRSATDVSLVNWKSSGLRTASTVRLSRLDCLEQKLLFARIGAITAADGHAIGQAWATYVKPQF